MSNPNGNNLSLPPGGGIGSAVTPSFSSFPDRPNSLSGNTAGQSTHAASTSASASASSSSLSTSSVVVASPPTFPSFPDLSRARSLRSREHERERGDRTGEFGDTERSTRDRKGHGRSSDRDDHRRDNDNSDKKLKRLVAIGRPEDDKRSRKPFLSESDLDDRRRRRRKDEERARGRKGRDGDEDGEEDETDRRNRSKYSGDDVDIQNRERAQDRKRERSRDIGGEYHRHHQHRHREDEESKQKNKHKHKHRESKKEKHKESEPAPEPDTSSFVPSLTGQRLPFFRTSEFIVDSQGDPNNLKYGRMSSSDVPRYHTRGAGRIVGLSDAYRIHGRNSYKSGKGVEVFVKGGGGGGGGGGGKGSSEEREPPNILLPSQVYRLNPKLRSKSRKDAENAITEQSDYILVAPGKRLRIGLTEPGEEDLPAYRSISRGGQDINRATEDGDCSEDQSGDEVDLELEETPEQTLRRKTIEYNRRTQENPQDINCWIEYARLHLGTSGINQSRQRNGTASAGSKRANAEVALSLLENGLKAHPNNQFSIKLQRETLNVLSTVEEPAKVTKRWRATLKMLERLGGLEEVSGQTLDDRELMEFWLEYISWREGRGLGTSTKKESKDKEGGGIEDVLAVYAECMQIMQDQPCRTFERQEAKEENLVYLLLRAVLLMKAAGYTERATATMQAMLEMTYFIPDRFRQPFQIGDPHFTFSSAVLDDFEEFWESEIPRIGEDSAPGWKTWDQTKLVARPKEVESETFPLEGTDPYSRWWHAEQQAERRDSRPMKVTDIVDEEDDEDPYRIIFYSDVRPYLFVIQSPEVKLQLIYAVMTFLGVPILPFNVSTNTAYSTDPHLFWHLSKNQVARDRLWPRCPPTRAVITLDGGAPVDPAVEKQPAVKLWQTSGDTLFGTGKEWFSLVNADDLQHVDSTLLKNLFSSLRPMIGDPGFTSTYLAIEASLSPKGAGKIAKTLLADDRNNIDLWIDYASILRKQKNKVHDARQVYMTCLRSVGSPTGPESPAMKLLSEWAMMEWDQGDLARAGFIASQAASTDLEAMERLLNSSFHPSTPTGPLLLRCQKFYESCPAPYSTAILSLSVIFQISTSDFDTALEFVRTYSQGLPSGSTEQEEALQLGCNLVDRQPLVRPVVWRELLDYCLLSFPSNTLFLTLYLQNESNARVYGRLQRLLHERILGREETGPAVFLWAVWAEGQLAARTFWTIGKGGAERVRSIFDRAVQAPNAQRSLSVWIAYVEFEVLQGRPQAAKSLCYRALAFVGACKDLYMLPFSPKLRPIFTSQELDAWSELMIEKGLRIRRPFESFWRKGGDTGGQILDVEGDDEVDESLRFLQERQKMMPY